MVQDIIYCARWMIPCHRVLVLVLIASFSQPMHLLHLRLLLIHFMDETRILLLGIPQETQLSQYQEVRINLQVVLKDTNIEQGPPP
jgi:hypothetical protein